MKFFLQLKWVYSKPLLAISTNQLIRCCFKLFSSNLILKVWDSEKGIYPTDAYGATYIPTVQKPSGKTLFIRTNTPKSSDKTALHEMYGLLLDYIVVDQLLLIIWFIEFHIYSNERALKQITTLFII